MQNQKNYLLYLAYGNRDILYEACYSILSFYAANAADADAVEVVVYTDAPALFEDMFRGKNLSCITLSAEQILEWRGSIDFVHRVKTEAIRDFLSRYSGNMIYVDSDTVFLGPLAPYWADIEAGSLIMHTMEGIISNRGNRIISKLYDFISNKPIYFESGTTLKMPVDTQLWNAGVIGMNSAHKELLNKIIAMTDAMYPACPMHVVEQLATSYEFQVSAPLKPTERDIFHYWNFKEFRQVLRVFFAHYAGQNWQAILPHISKISPMKLEGPKREYQALKPIPKFFRKLRKQRWQMPDFEV